MKTVKIKSKRKSPHQCQECLARKVLLKAPYYQSGDLFYHRLWRERLQAIGFRVYHVEKGASHPVWDIRLTGSLTAQAYLLLSKPAKKWILSPDLLERQLKEEIRRMAKEMGPPIKSGCLHVRRGGNYWRISLVWEGGGRAGVLLLTHPKPGPFSGLIQPWLRRARN